MFPLDANKLHAGRIESDGTIAYEVGTITIGTDSVTYQADVAWRGFYTDYIQVSGSEKLTITPNMSSTISWACNCYDTNDNFLGKATSTSTSTTRIFTLLQGTVKIRISITSSELLYTITNPMLNTGSSALPYEPYSSEVWHDTPNYIHKTDTDTFTTLPAVLYPTGTTATVGLKGNTAQSGTPSPQNPVIPQGCGDLETSGAKAGQYKIPISINNVVTDIYIGDNPLRKSLDGTAYDTLAADGTLTRRVDSDGSVLPTPIVTQVTMPTFTTTPGANTLDVLTTVPPSEVTATFNGWHPVGSAHERNNGAWT